jgi:hypothetical protein
VLRRNLVGVHRRRRIGIVGLLAAALGAAEVGVHATSAASTRAARATTTDATYSCRVRRAHFIDLSASVTLPPTDNRAQPGVLVLTTGVRSVTKDGTTTTVAQVGLRAVKHGSKIDKKSCVRVAKRIPLKSKGLPGPAITVTPTHQGFDNEQCGTKARVLVRLRLQMTNQIPSHALLAVRNDDAKRRPIAFYNWSPRKLTIYTGSSCSSSP